MIAIGADVALVAAIPGGWIGSRDGDGRGRVNSGRVVAIRTVRDVVIILLGFSVGVRVVGGNAGVAVDILVVFGDTGAGLEVQ